MMCFTTAMFYIYIRKASRRSTNLIDVIGSNEKISSIIHYTIDVCPKPTRTLQLFFL